MRNAAIDALTKMAETDDRITFVTADLGYSVLEDFAEKFPERFFNVGICEQAMSSVAAGLALSGEIVFTYSIGNFATLRCIEQIRNDICYHNANVKIIAVGGGVSYGQLGMSHHATEDIAMMRALPHMRVLTPADPEEALAAARYAVQTEGPCYIRLARRGEPVLYPKAGAIDVTKVQTVIPGEQVAVIGCGPIVAEVKKACETLRHRGIEAGAYSVPCVSPLDRDAVRTIARQADWVVTVEEHQITGGLGSAVAEALCDLPDVRQLRMGIPDEYPHIVGSHEYLCDYYGLSADKIAEKILSVMGMQP